MNKYNQIYILFLFTSIVLNMLFISILNRLVPNNLIFFTLIATSTTVSVCGTIAINKIYKKTHSESTENLEIVGGGGISYFLSILSINILVGVFGPVFIDRSLSYHIAFFCTEKKQISKNEIVSLFNNRIIDKRIEESIRSGFIKECGVQVYCPTEKGKLFSELVMAVGSITNTINEYKREKKQNYE